MGERWQKFGETTNHMGYVGKNTSIPHHHNSVLLAILCLVLRCLCGVQVPCKLYIHFWFCVFFQIRFYDFFSRAEIFRKRLWRWDVKTEHRVCETGGTKFYKRYKETNRLQGRPHCWYKSRLGTLVRWGLHFYGLFCFFAERRSRGHQSGRFWRRTRRAAHGGGPRPRRLDGRGSCPREGTLGERLDFLDFFKESSDYCCDIRYIWYHSVFIILLLQ